MTSASQDELDNEDYIPRLNPTVVRSTIKQKLLFNLDDSSQEIDSQRFHKINEEKDFHYKDEEKTSKLI